MSGAPYEVGYGKPPEHTRFKKGNSGNPRGRAPGHRSIRTELLQELSSRVDVVENGARRRVSKQTLILKRLVSDAAKGDSRAREQLLKIIGPIELMAASAAPQKDAGPKDEQILARFRARLVAELKESGGV